MIQQKPILYLYTTPRGLVEPDTRVKRFWRKVRRGGDGCHEWKGARSDLGYGILGITLERFTPHVRLYAHRVAWVLHHSRDIPDGYVIDHTCGNKGCCNPGHLDCVTQTANVERYHAANPGSGLCKRGHSIQIGENCRICRDARVAAWYAAHPNAKREQSQRYEAKRSLIRKAATRARQAQS